MCAWRNWTVTMTDSGGSTTCGFGIKVMAEKPQISYPKYLEFVHRKPISTVSANLGSSCAPIDSCG